MAAHQIRVMGDPVLRQRAADVTDIDDALVQLANDMVDVMYEAPGLGVAAPQVGVGKRFFVYDVSADDEGQPSILINPRIVESEGEWTFNEGCLSIPGLYFEIIRPKVVHVVGVDLDGNEVSIEADELLGRLFQHEIDHLDGVLMTERLENDQRKEAKRAWREILLARDEGRDVRGEPRTIPLP